MRGVDMEHVAATVADAMKAVLMIGDIRLREEQVGVAGDIYILDASVATPQNFAQHFAKFTPALLKKFFICVQVIISKDHENKSFWSFHRFVLIH